MSLVLILLILLLDCHNWELEVTESSLDQNNFIVGCEALGSFPNIDAVIIHGNSKKNSISEADQIRILLTFSLLSETVFIYTTEYISEPNGIWQSILNSVISNQKIRRLHYPCPFWWLFLLLSILTNNWNSNLKDFLKLFAFKSGFLLGQSVQHKSAF